jgi:hypothetical protein
MPLGILVAKNSLDMTYVRARRFDSGMRSGKKCSVKSERVMTHEREAEGMDGRTMLLFFGK